ncbi:Peptidoglycan-recognition protein LA [Eumeta japonica]|uniref:Peptidoglycan-recognition protein LA n=1 Tax=Eumeta variegata TaxID=151549 RepID=A0A4C1SDL6_EUMVA|nr:Peptidoglycan-recognition protein LA [Eumeta japonica]
MRTIQDSAIAEKGLPDIQSNFYVGSDGYVYVGRGWNWANTYANYSLAITFMGDFGRYIPNDKQIEATQYLLAHASTNKYIDLNYKLVAQNQLRTQEKQERSFTIDRKSLQLRNFATINEQDCE